jgi:NTE family protein
MAYFHSHFTRIVLLLALLLSSTFGGQAQTVGLVLSGGGAVGMSHVGVLKALEQNLIPIDFICGTSMGAVIAALYASGYSVAQIEGMMTSDEFKKMAEGTADDKHIYFFKQKEIDASWITFKFDADSIFETSIPTSIIDPAALDIQLMQQYMGAAAAAGYNFDSLFIPFRCVSSDIVAKESIVYKGGRLTESVRASMSYPFYLKPIRVNGILMFDGGLYNNFPTDVMYDEFFPDIIIGSNVSDRLEPPDPDNVISQIKNMLLRRDDFSIICENGILIEPKATAGTFDFSGIADIIAVGYEATMAKMDTIKMNIERRESAESLAARRAIFNAKKPALSIDEIEIRGLSKRSQIQYVRRILGERKGPVMVDKLVPRYFRILSDDKIKFIYPRAQFKPKTGHYNLNLEVQREKELFADFGGNFSSRPINTGFLALKYNFMGKTAWTISANSYFGKFYGSANLKARFDFPTKLQFYVEPEFMLNRWDYFRSFATFFEDVKPSFLVKNEQFIAANIGMPVRNKGRLQGDYKLMKLRNEYYQDDDFTSVDTADLTSFNGWTTGLFYERSTLNRKQYASAGTYLTLTGRYVSGQEQTIHGSTKPETEPLQEIYINFSWWRFKLEYENFFKRKGLFRFAFHTEMVYSNMPTFSNYTATILAAPSFQPIPESKTLFQEQFRAHAYGSLGLKTVIAVQRNIDFRLEGYAFLPYETIQIVENTNLAEFSPIFNDQYFMSSIAAVYHSPLGPVSFSANYYDFNKDDPWSFIFNFGYIIFNRQALN